MTLSKYEAKSLLSDVKDLIKKQFISIFSFKSKYKHLNKLYSSMRIVQKKKK